MKRFPLTPLPVVVYVAVGDEFGALRRKVGFHDDPPVPEVDGRTWLNGQTVGVWLNGGIVGAPWVTAAEVIAHESQHVLDYAYDVIGDRNAGDELHAYLTGYVVEHIARYVDSRRT